MRSARAERIGIKDFDAQIHPDAIWSSGDVVFSATGVTDGSMLHGVQRDGDFVTTESVVMRSATGTVRWIKARHRRDMSEAAHAAGAVRRGPLLFRPALAAGARAMSRSRSSCSKN